MVALGVVLRGLGGESRAETVAVFYALEADLAEMKAGALATSAKAAGVSWERFSAGNHTVVAAKMGVGNTLAAVTAGVVLAKTGAARAFSIGPAGALAEAPGVGEVARVWKVAGYERGTWQGGQWLAALEGVVDVSGALEWSVPEVMDKLTAARLASGHAFVACGGRREMLREQTGCELVDMNAFGVAVACKRAGVPLVVLRVVSDKAD